MTRLAEAYIHLDVRASRYEKEAVEKYISHLSQSVAAQVYQQQRQHIEISIRVEDGSLKAWAAAGGIIYTAIAGYGSFRSGIDYLVKDARTFGEVVTSSFVETAGIPKEKVLRVERRLAIPGKIQRLYGHLDKLKEDIEANTLTKKELVKLKKEIGDIANGLDRDVDTEVFSRALVSDYRFLNLPMPEQPNPNETITMPVIRHHTYEDYVSDGTLSEFANEIHQHLVLRGTKNA